MFKNLKQNLLFKVIQLMIILVVLFSIKVFIKIYLEYIIFLLFLRRLSGKKLLSLSEQLSFLLSLLTLFESI